MLARTAQDPAVTRFTSAAVPGRPGIRAFLVKPESGRTHQLRVALKSLGSPVLGDEVRRCCGAHARVRRHASAHRGPSPAAPIPALQRYAQADVAAAADRTYLHAAALRFWCQGSAVQVVCPPADGEEFSSPGFRELFDAWLPAALEAEPGCWFEDNRLMRSELPPLPMFPPGQ